MQWSSQQINLFEMLWLKKIVRKWMSLWRIKGQNSSKMKDTDKVMQKKLLLAVATHTFLNISLLTFVTQNKH